MYNKKKLKLIVIINSHGRVYTLLEKLGAAALLQAAPIRMKNRKYSFAGTISGQEQD
jgi:hypothetical protein